MKDKISTEEFMRRKNTLPHFKVNKGVKPYGGRIFPGVQNGKAVKLYVDTQTGYTLAMIGGADARNYSADEVVEVERIGRRWIPVKR